MATAPIFIFSMRILFVLISFDLLGVLCCTTNGGSWLLYMVARASFEFGVLGSLWLG